MLFKCFHLRDRCLQMTLFNTFVHPVFEFNSPIWSPFFIKNVSTIVFSKYFMKNLRGLKNIPYKQYLAILNQPFL